MTNMIGMEDLNKATNDQEKFDTDAFVEESILGESFVIRKVKELIKQISQHANVPVLLEGETGTGKNLIAKVVHYASQSDGRPFVEVNCAAIPENLLESQLFGHEKGAFTGAVSKKKGLVDESEGGTLFLDEISSMPLALQAKLLTFLESHTYRPVGATKKQKVDVRVIAASNQDLSGLVEQGDFREDLYFRLNVIKIDLPPLREMKDDLEPLALNFIGLFNQKYEKQVSRMSQDALKKLRNHPWPGNVRELRNAMERAVVLASSDEIADGNILVKDSPALEPGNASPLEQFTLPEEGIAFAELERRVLEQALERSKGNQTQAARLLSISRETLRYRVEKYKLV